MRNSSHKRPPHLFTRAALCLALAALSAACAAASRDVDTSKPRAGASYPVTLTTNDERIKASRDAWARLLSDQGIAASATPELQPITATLKALPATLASPLRLPRIGEAGKEPTEEETREALRRFLTTVSTPLGAQVAELSLVAYGKLSEGLTRAVYQQNPFAHPLRGGYGRVELTFTPDLRVVSLSSTAVPDVERLRSAVNAITQERLTAERAVASIAGRAVTYVDASGTTQTRNVAAQGEAAARELVIYPIPSASDPATLEFHLAWEIAVGGNPQLFVYVDAIDGRQIAATLAPKSE